MANLGRILLILGLAAAVLGGALLLADRLPWLARIFQHLGRLPGDITIERPGFRLSFPIVTCLLLSLILSLVLWLFRR